MMNNKLIDGIIKEPIGGTHTFPEQAYKNVKRKIKESIKECKSVNVKKLVQTEWINSQIWEFIANNIW